MTNSALVHILEIIYLSYNSESSWKGVKETLKIHRAREGTVEYAPCGVHKRRSIINDSVDNYRLLFFLFPSNTTHHKSLMASRDRAGARLKKCTIIVKREFLRNATSTSSPRQAQKFETMTGGIFYRIVRYKSEQPNQIPGVSFTCFLEGEGRRNFSTRRSLSAGRSVKRIIGRHDRFLVQHEDCVRADCEPTFT